jgi:hypothetical protein
LSRRTENAPSARNSSTVTTTSYQTTGAQRAWEEVGETTIRTISRLCTGGATQKRDRAEPKNDERSGAVTAYLNGGRRKLIAEVTEVESGKKDRPELIKALSLCRIHNATLIIAKLDRLARNFAFISNLM